MNKLLQLLIIPFLIILLSGCGSSDTKKPDNKNPESAINDTDNSSNDAVSEDDPDNTNTGNNSNSDNDPDATDSDTVNDDGENNSSTPNNDSNISDTDDDSAPNDTEVPNVPVGVDPVIRTLEVGYVVDFASDVAIESFGGVNGSIADGVLTAVKTEGAETWGGNVIAKGLIIYPLTEADSIMSARVYSDSAATIRMKLELASDANQSDEVDSIVAHTGSGWETLEFNFANTNAIDANFDTLVLFSNFGVSGAGETYQYDDITFVGGNGGVSAAPEFAITFQVDMTGLEVSADGVYLAGGNFGQDGHLMADAGNGIWSVTLQLTAETYLYKFRNQAANGTWDGFEDVAGIISGGCNSGDYNDRFVVVADTDSTLGVVAYGSCTADAYVAPAAPTLPTAPVPSDAADSVLSIFGTTYGNIYGGDFNPNWGQVTSVEVGDNLAYTNLNYQGTQFTNSDVSGYEFLNVDYYVTESTRVDFFLISPGAETSYSLDVSATDQWNSVQIPLSHYADVVNLADAFQFKVEGDGTVAFNNLYFGGTSEEPLVPADIELPKQLISVDGNPSATQGQSVSISISYDVSNSDSSLTGLGLSVHYDSSVITFAEFLNVLDINKISSNGPSNDDEDLDNDASTDRYVSASWASVLGSWPGELPASLLTINFNTAEDVDVDATTIGFSSISNTAGYTFSPTSYDMSIIDGDTGDETSVVTEPEASAVSFSVTAEGAASVKLHSSGFNWDASSQVEAISNGDGTWTATVDPRFTSDVDYKWIIDEVEEDLSTAFRAGECANDNVAGYSDTWFNRTWVADAGDVTGDIAGACSDTDLSPTESELGILVGDSADFNAMTNATWKANIILALKTDGASSRNAQTMSINVTELPEGGANYRVYKTTANGNDYFGPAQSLAIGINSITVGAVGFDRAVKIQVSSTDIKFDALSVNGMPLYP